MSEVGSTGYEIIWLINLLELSVICRGRAGPKERELRTRRSTIYRKEFGDDRVLFYQPRQPIAMAQLPKECKYQFQGVLG